MISNHRHRRILMLASPNGFIYFILFFNVFAIAARVPSLPRVPIGDPSRGRRGRRRFVGDNARGVREGWGLDWAGLG